MYIYNIIYVYNIHNKYTHTHTHTHTHTQYAAARQVQERLGDKQLYGVVSNAGLFYLYIRSLLPL